MEHKTKDLNNKGFTVVELIITIAILSFGIIGIYNFLEPAIISNANSSNRLISVYLAQEGLEIIKNIRDNNIIAESAWSQGFSICATGCQLDYKTGTATETPLNQLQPYQNIFLNINSDGFYSYDSGNNTIFKRKVVIIEPTASSDILKVDVLVTWNHNGLPFNFSTIGYIYNTQ